MCVRDVYEKGEQWVSEKGKKEKLLYMHASKSIMYKYEHIITNMDMQCRGKKIRPKDLGTDTYVPSMRLSLSKTSCSSLRTFTCNISTVSW